MNYLDKLRHLDQGLHLDPIEQTRSSMVHPVDWAARWRTLAQMTSGLEQDDPRLDPVLSALAQCQHAHEAQVTWKSSQGHQALGAARVEHVHVSDGRLFVFVVWQDTGRWISETAITSIEGTK